MTVTPRGLAKISWQDPGTGVVRDYVLTEGATVTLGRGRESEIHIPEQHVSRQHAVITHEFGVFMIKDLNSANGTYVNDEKITDPFPLAHGDVIRLYVPVLNFSAVVTADDEATALKTGSMIMATNKHSRPKLILTAGAQEGLEIPLITDSVTIGRSVSSATWDIKLEDRSVSRPHARIEKQGEAWYVTDLGSANGTLVNSKPLTTPIQLQDGYVVVLGETTILFRFASTLL
jgi:pSer/pThr/pTyr-binding forkhead associated (FHA) protein